MREDSPQATPIDVAQALRDAIRALAADPVRAEAIARELLQAAPDNVDARALLGAALREQGRLEPSRAALEPLVRDHPGSWVAQFQGAQTLFALGLSRAAVEPLRRTLALNAGLSVGWRMLGDILLASGQLPQAQTAYDRMLGAVLGRGPLLQAADDLACGRLIEAERTLRGVHADPTAQGSSAHLLGEVLARQGRLTEAIDVLTECVRATPGDYLARQAYAFALFRADRCAEALVELDILLARKSDDYRVRMTKAAVLTEMGDFAAAADVTETVLAAFPDQPQAWLVHGHGLRTLGRIQDSIAAYDRCLELDPGCSAAYWSLANLKTYRFTPPVRAALETRLTRGDLAPEDRSHLHFTLGKVLEDEARFDEAFDHYARANAIEHGRRDYDPQRLTDFVRRAKALLTPQFFAERTGWGQSAPDPIFIVGLPRSGSTLIEQILTSHPAVEGTRELMDLQLIADWIAGPDAPDCLARMASLPPELCAKLGGDYLAWTQARRRLGRARFTDKAPWNFMHAGLIQLILPKARIIDVRRHPLGCCLSTFKQHFAQGFDFAYDLGDLGRYYADYVELMAHYDAVAPGRVRRVIYEAMVEDPEGETRRLLADLDLAFDPACLRFFDNPRAVATPSSQQVRQPIFADAVDHWRRFEPWLGPLKAALGPALQTYPDAPVATAGVQA